MRVVPRSKEIIFRLPIELIENLRTIDKRDLAEFLTVGQEYVVYGIEVSNGVIGYWLHDWESESRDSMPNWYQAYMFDIVDSRIPKCWQARLHFGSDFGDSSFLITYSEWTNSDSHSWLLSEDDEMALNIWRRRRLEIDNDSIK